jgi:hypothetical protein
MEEPKTSEEAAKAWREELLGYLREMGRFKDFEFPIEILRKLSAFSARARYIHNQIGSSKNRVLRDFKYEEVIPFLNEAEFQFKVWSRVVSINNLEWDMTK